MKSVLITGASSGIGEATARALYARGYRVYAGARRVEKMSALRDVGICTIHLDVTSEVSMQACVAKIESEAGKLDVLINNAGYGSYGAFEEISMEEARAQMEVNVFGLARLSQLFIPKMRESKSGTIINVSSIGGVFGEAYGAWYHATKYAIEGLSDSLALELQPFGIHVITIEPGAIKTEWGNIAAHALLQVSGNGPYSVQAKKKAKSFDDMYKSPIAVPPSVVANGILKILDIKNPKFRYGIGGGATQLLLLRKFTSDRVFYGLLNKILGV